MLKRFLTCAALVAGLTLLHADASAAQSGSLCLGPDTNSTAIVNWVRHIIKGTNVHIDSLRDNIGLGGVDTSSVSVVTKSQTCGDAAAAIDNLANLWGTMRKVYVIQAGRQRYIVQDPNDKAGDWVRTWVFDSRFHLVSALGY
jgi:hypothetical protein